MIKKSFILAFLAFVLPHTVNSEERGRGQLLVKSRTPLQTQFENTKVLSKNSSWYRVSVSSGNKLKTIEMLHHNPNVEWVEEDHLYQVDQIENNLDSITTNDPYFGNQWSLQKSHVTDAWALVPANAKNVLVAVIDTGIEASHPEFADKIFTNTREIPNNGVDDDHNGLIDDVHGWDFEAKNNDPSDDFNHGSHVAGIIGAVQNNKFGIAGISAHVQILPIKWMKKGSGWGADAIEAIYYASNMGAKIINASWGGIGYSKALEDAVKYAESKGVLFVAASGNRGTDNDKSPQHPANLRLPNVIAVANTDEKDELVRSSNYGVIHVDIAAPGNNIVSTMMNHQFGSLSGTSMAAAHVSGVAALLLSLNPKLTAQDLKRVILGTVTKLPSLQGKIVSGGRINAVDAAKKVISEMKSH